ncbi:hypothetical protein LTR08_006388 [Meristemomyces frigidus]|nr:hypothetical protein LTR08_006388 [Meristemomyces frigidus]
MAAMDPPLPPAFRLPPKDWQPLHSLSPERVNGTRPLSALSTTTNATRSTKTLDTDLQREPSEISSAHSSPTRKANLFADYHPKTPSGSPTRGFALPQSPSLPEIHVLRSHARNNSDVQGLVKRFEHLDVRDKDAENAERRKRHEAELNRAQIAREEAESDCKRLRQEIRSMRKDSEEGRESERKIGRRLETVMEEYAHAKESYTSQHAIYEKELRKAKKEAFKSSSAGLKLQEELKSTRNSLRITQSGFDLEKQKVQRREQDTFNAQYQLAVVQEELDKLRAHLRIAQEEKEALKTSLKEEEIARIAAEGMIALPPPKEDDEEDFSASPRRNSLAKRAPSPLSDDKENIGAVSKKMLEASRLEEELQREQRRRERAEEMIEFLKLECRFQCCGCQTATKRGHSHAPASFGELEKTMESLMEEMMSTLIASNEQGHAAEQIQVDVIAYQEVNVLEADTQTPADVEVMSGGENVQASKSVPGTSEPEDDRSITLAAEYPFVQQFAVDNEEPMAPHATPTQKRETETNPEIEAEHLDEVEQVNDAPEDRTIQASYSPPKTPELHHQIPIRHHHNHNHRTVTTTTTVPMHFTPVAYKHPIEDAENIPPPSAEAPTFDRAAALAAIEYRRGRAKSMASGHMTPRKQMLEGVNVKERRDISAPALGGKTVGGVGYAKGASSVGRAGGRRMG